MVKVLIAAAEPSLSNNLQEFFIKEGCQALIAPGAQALDKVRLEKPQFIILDIDFFGMKWPGILEKIRQIDKEAVIIVVTSIKDKSAIEKMIRLGAFNCISKPAGLDSIKHSLKSTVTMIEVERFSGIDILFLDYDEEKIRDLLGVFSKKGYKVKSVETQSQGAAETEASCDLLILRVDILRDNAISILSKYKDASPGLPVICTVNSGTAADLFDKIKGYGHCRYLDKASNVYKLTMIIYKIIAEYQEKKKIKEGKGPSDYILIVDDDPDIYEFTRTYLLREGYKVSVLSDPKYVLEQVELLKPLIVLLDLVMPEISGLELLKKIKEISPKTKVIIMTGLKDVSICRESIELGASDYLVKPFSLEQLKAMIIVASMKPS